MNAASKYITFLTTENLLVNFPCSVDLKTFLILSIQKYLKESDIFGFIQCNEDGNIFIEKMTIRTIEDFKTKTEFFETEKKFEKNKKIKVDFSRALWNVTEQTRFLDKGNLGNLDKIIFCFMNSEDFRINSEDDQIFEELLHENVAVYCFLFDDPEEKKLNRIKQFVKNLDEGHIILVKNYEIIERAFQNISYSSENKNKILNIKYSNNNFII